MGTVNVELSLTVIIAALALLVFKTTTPDKLSLDIDAVLQDRDDFGPFRDARAAAGMDLRPLVRQCAEGGDPREVLDKGSADSAARPGQPGD